MGVRSTSGAESSCLLMPEFDDVPGGKPEVEPGVTAGKGKLDQSRRTDERDRRFPRVAVGAGESCDLGHSRAAGTVRDEADRGGVVVPEPGLEFQLVERGDRVAEAI